MAKQTKTDKEIENFFEELFKLIGQNPLTSFLILLGGLGYFFRKPLFAFYDRLSATYGEGVKQGIQAVCILVIVVFLLGLVRKAIVYFVSRQRFRYVRLLPHEADSFTAKEIQKMVRSFYYIPQPYFLRFLVGKQRFSFVTTKDGQGEVSYYLGADKSQLTQAIATFSKGNYPHLEVYEGADLIFPQEIRKGKVFGFAVFPAKKKPLPYQAFHHDFSGTIAQQLPNQSCIQVTFENYPLKKFRKQMNVLEKATQEADGNQKVSRRLSRDKELLRDMGQRFQSDEVIYQTKIGFSSVGKQSKTQLFDVFNTIAGQINDSNQVKRRRFPTFLNQRATEPYFSFCPTLLFTGSELANLVHLPALGPDKATEAVRETIPHLSDGLGALKDDVMADPNDLYLGTMQHPVIKDRKVYIQQQFIAEHFATTGNTGSGKSTVLNTLISRGFFEPFLKDSEKIQSGVTFLDPARDTVTTFFNWLLKAETDGKKVNWAKVHYFKVADSAFPIPMNLLGRIDGVSIEVQANAITEIIENVFENKAEVAVRLLRFSIHTLLADDQHVHTILEVPKLLDDEEYREQILERLDYQQHYALINYWQTDALDNIKTSAVAVKNRIDIFSNSNAMKRVFGQQENELMVRKYMDEGHMVFFDLSNLSNTEINVIAGYISYLYYRVAETRPIKSLLHLLLIDEAHRVGDVPILPKIVAESRKFGLGLGISTQRLKQLSKELQGALRGVQNNFFVCRQGSEDSKIASENIGKNVVKPSTLEELEPLEVVVKYPFEYPSGEREQQQFLVKVPPLDKYQQDGSVAPFKNPDVIQAVDRWTIEQAQKLMEKRGYRTAEQADRAIFAYMSGKTARFEEEPEKVQVKKGKGFQRTPAPKGED
ncbi:MAG: DUF87 domain-containing protein [Staphylococcus epidermidis]|nr:DUF87 domain-containing protein [Staphylococcus epidermidis]MDU5315170.1 DUF87 domain-containing protein [Enterococcus faecalis]